MGFVQYRSRLIYSLMRAAARVGLRLGVRLDHMVSLLQMAYFREARDVRGLELSEVSEIFGKSLRTVSSLNRRFRGDFFSPELDVGFRRDVAGSLALSPKTKDELVAGFSDFSHTELAHALRDLQRDGRVVLYDGRYHRNPDDHVFYDMASTATKIDGLNRQMDVLAETVWRRLVDRDPAPTVTARTYVFSATDEGMEKLLEELRVFLQDRCIATDSDARAHGLTNRTGITLAATPMEGE